MGQLQSIFWCFALLSFRQVWWWLLCVVRKWWRIDLFVVSSLWTIAQCRLLCQQIARIGSSKWYYRKNLIVKNACFMSAAPSDAMLRRFAKNKLARGNFRFDDELWFNWWLWNSMRRRNFSLGSFKSSSRSNLEK